MLYAVFTVEPGVFGRYQVLVYALDTVQMTLFTKKIHPGDIIAFKVSIGMCNSHQNTCVFHHRNHLRYFRIGWEMERLTGSVHQLGIFFLAGNKASLNEVTAQHSVFYVRVSLKLYGFGRPVGLKQLQAMSIGKVIS